MFQRMRTGLREMPSNAVWIFSRALKPAEALGDAAAGARDQGWRATAAVVDAAPVGDSVEIRARRAHEAAERAREAEERAVEAARTSKELADRAREVSERGRARVEELDRALSRQVEQRVAEARKAAEEFVKRERQDAEADAEEEREDVEEEVESEIAEAESDAEASQRRAEELVEDATEALAEARQLADEAAEAARSAAQEANRQAQQLQNEARQRASDTEARVKAAEGLRERPAATAKHTARELDRETTDGGLDAYKKPELVELAASIGIENRTNMTKPELVDAITKAARRRARQGASA
jgi:colicin import membrane protein